MSPAECCWCGSILVGEVAPDGAACLCRSCRGEPTPPPLPVAPVKRKRFAWLAGAGIAAVVLVLACGLSLYAFWPDSDQANASQIEDDPPQAPASATHPLTAASLRPGQARFSLGAPETVIRSGPAPGEPVAWTRGGPAVIGGRGKAAVGKPETAARLAPPPGQQAAWAKVVPEAPVVAVAAAADSLLEQLAAAPEVGLGKSANAVVKSWDATLGSALQLGGGRVTDASPVLKCRPDLATLPIRSGPDCQLSPRAAGNLAVLSPKLNAYIDGLAPLKPDGTRVSSDNLRKVLTEEKHGKRPEWLRVEAVPALQQILMHEEPPLRRLLVDLLAQVPQKQATAALVRRALFDLDPDIRAAARAALKGRNLEDCRPVLLRALRYPWAPAAQHAAETLVALNDKSSIPHLVTLLDQPDPAGVQTIKGKYIQQDLVRIRHVFNCLLCHAPSATGNDVCLKLAPWVQRRVRMTGKQIQSLVAAGKLSLDAVQGYGTSGQAALAANLARGGRGVLTVPTPVMIRFDTTFLRQDFSVQLPVAGPGTNMRFDFVVRTRVISAKKAEKLLAEAKGQGSYPQRDSVLFALRQLSGLDEGSSSLAWQQLFPDADEQVQAEQQLRKLLQAGPLELPLLLKGHVQARGDVHTRVLTAAVDRLAGSARQEARSALAGRLSALERRALLPFLLDGRAGVRQSAVLAGQLKKDKSLVPLLIGRLDDGDEETGRLARLALKTLTGQDFKNANAALLWWRHALARAER
jgi:HEAT repeat protein